jgi:hypothetical protein
MTSDTLNLPRMTEQIRVMRQERYNQTSARGLSTDLVYMDP